MRSKASFAQHSPLGLAKPMGTAKPNGLGCSLLGSAGPVWLGWAGAKGLGSKGKGKGKGEACFSLRAKLLLKLEGLILDFGEYYGLLWTLCAIT